MSETQTVIRVERMLWRKFKAECLLRDTNPTAVINIFIMERVKSWEEDRQHEAMARYHTRKALKQYPEHKPKESS